MPLKQGTQYKWEDTATFTLNSKQFSILCDAINNIVAATDFQEKAAEARKTVAISNAHVQLNEVLSAAVDEGVAVEFTNE